jgi:hypothetical protein
MRAVSVFLFKLLGGALLLLGLSFVYVAPIALPVLAGMLTYSIFQWLFFDESFLVYHKLLEWGGSSFWFRKNDALILVSFLVSFVVLIGIQMIPGFLERERRKE